MNKINAIPNILVGYLERSSTSQVTLSSTDMNSLKLQTMMFSNPYTCVELELNGAQGNNFNLKVPIKLFLNKARSPSHGLEYQVWRGLVRLGGTYMSFSQEPRFHYFVSLP